MQRATLTVLRDDAHRLERPRVGDVVDLSHDAPLERARARGPAR